EQYTVNVTMNRQETRTEMRTVSEQVPATEEYVENVTRYQPVTRQGVRKRLVAETVQESVPTTETFTVLVPYTYTVKVPVAAPAPAPAPMPCPPAPQGNWAPAPAPVPVPAPAGGGCEGPGGHAQAIGPAHDPAL